MARGAQNADGCEVVHCEYCRDVGAVAQKADRGFAPCGHVERTELNKLPGHGMPRSAVGVGEALDAIPRGACEGRPRENAYPVVAPARKCSAAKKPPW